MTATLSEQERRTYECRRCGNVKCVCDQPMKHAHQTPLQFAISNAATDEREEAKLRQMVIYATETATVDVVQKLGKALDEILTLAFLEKR